MPQGFALETAASVEVIAAYSAPHTAIRAVTSSPGWYVLGAFYLPKTVKLARVDALLMVSAAGLTVRVRLFDMEAKAPVSGSLAQSTSTAMERRLSGSVQLTGNRVYQLQCECTGAVGDDKFAVVKTATITD